MHVETLTLGPFATNCFIISNDTGEALIVDPGNEAGVIIETVRAQGLQVALLLLTHGHMDHVAAVAEVAQALEAPVAMHPVDARWAFTPMNAMPPYYDTPVSPGPMARDLAEGQEWLDIGLRYRVLELPGHSPGHVAFYFEDENVIFSGDVLFQGSCGRVDLPGGDGPTLMRSLRRMAGLPPATRVYCGHGPDTTIGDELRHNPYLRDA
jgi:hydroxyacylglutathione hydrolase